ncbi:MAG: AAA family ATPase [Gemmatimonadaceae bacterium]
MQRKALIVAGAAGSLETAGSVLMRFGFGEPSAAIDVSGALAELQQHTYDLLVLPLQDIDPLQLVAVERAFRAGRVALTIGTAPRAEPDLILRAMRSGIQEFLVYPPEPKDLATALDRLMRRTNMNGQRGSVFALYSGKGGLGTTSIAANLAHALAKGHRESRVSIADLVVTDGDIRVFLNLKPAYDLGDLVKKLDRVDAELLYSLMTPYREGIWALPGPDDPEYDDLLDGATIGTILEQLRSHFAFTVLDCEHHMSERTLAAMDGADRILLVTQLNVPALRSTQRSLALCRRLGYPNDKMCVVVNRYQSGEVLSLTDATDVLKCEIFWKLPNDYRTSAGALMKGIPVAELDASSKLAWSYSQLAAKLAGVGEVSRNGSHRASGRTLRALLGMKKRV